MTPSGHDSLRGRRSAAARRRARHRSATSGLLLCLALAACSPEDPANGSGADGDDGDSAGAGPAAHMTRLEPGELGGLGEYSDSRSMAGVDIEVGFPEVPGAGPLTEQLEDLVDQEVEDFALAEPGAEQIAVEGAVTALSDEAVGIRLRTEEHTDAEDAEEEYTDGERFAFQTVWYEPETGRTASSAELLANYAALAQLAELAAANALTADGEGSLDGGRIWPMARLFDSIGFNGAGDLVVEFDEGQAAAPAAGRVHLVVDSDAAQPLLSELGRRAQRAAAEAPEEAEVPEPSQDLPDLREPPGVLPPADAAVDCSGDDTRCVALTFDDGPGGRTPELLDVLDEYGAKATFFVTGGPASRNRDTMRRIYAEGHELGNHTMSHPDLTGLSDSGVADETEPVQALIRRETGYTPSLMRPPYGASDSGLRDLMAEAGMAEVLWSVDTNDWRDRDPDIVADRALDGTQDGAIVLFHDIHDSTIDAFPQVMEALDEQGFTSVTVTQLLGSTEPGESYVDGSDGGD